MNKPYYADAQERFNLLNDTAREVLNSIDRPMRPLIIELNRIGIDTLFCCCGYSYEGEEEPKSHQPTPDIIFVHPKEDYYFSRFVYLAKAVGWAITLMSESLGEYSAHYINSAFWVKSDNLTEAVHDYEWKLIGIVNLVQTLKLVPSAPGREKEFVLHDLGNKKRREGIWGEEWLIKPKKPSTIQLEVVCPL